MKTNHFMVITVLCLGISTLIFAETLAIESGAESEEADIQATGGPAGAGKYLKLLSAGDFVSTTSTSFVDMPGMTASIRASGRAPACITATFSGHFKAGASPGPSGSLHLRALVDAELMQGHRDTFDEVGAFLQAGEHYLLSYTFWKCDVTPGAHTVKIQWYTHAGAPSLDSFARTLIVGGR